MRAAQRDRAARVAARRRPRGPVKPSRPSHARKRRHIASVRPDRARRPISGRSGPSSRKPRESGNVASDCGFSESTRTVTCAIRY
ncbi:hypothetical protein A33K_13626 [Burkholderia humptydooensis MSMB43]|uniref:Uncharacterized protein n=1 Tax=Burkholderia humptydooensis MSMB43 TaxID=441157 RepID=A0ABN0GCZ1_9BURK|nr:hypothetical protein A33K_13626 [Burkholderia humptydooensis MSMB43]